MALQFQGKKIYCFHQPKNGASPIAKHAFALGLQGILEAPCHRALKRLAKEKKCTDYNPLGCRDRADLRARARVSARKNAVKNYFKNSKYFVLKNTIF